MFQSRSHPAYLCANPPSPAPCLVHPCLRGGEILEVQAPTGPVDTSRTFHHPQPATEFTFVLPAPAEDPLAVAAAAAKVAAEAEAAAAAETKAADGQQGRTGDAAALPLVGADDATECSSPALVGGADAGGEAGGGSSGGSSASASSLVPGAVAGAAAPAAGAMAGGPDKPPSRRHSTEDWAESMKFPVLWLAYAPAAPPRSLHASLGGHGSRHVFYASFGGGAAGRVWRCSLRDPQATTELAKSVATAPTCFYGYSHDGRLALFGSMDGVVRLQVSEGGG